MGELKLPIWNFVVLLLRGKKGGEKETKGKECKGKEEKKDMRLPHERGERNKKYELILKRRATDYGCSCLQVVLVYLHPFCHNPLLVCTAAKNRKKTLKPPFGRFKVVQGH